MVVVVFLYMYGSVVIVYLFCNTKLVKIVLVEFVTIQFL